MTGKAAKNQREIKKDTDIREIIVFNPDLSSILMFVYLFAHKRSDKIDMYHRIQVLN